MRNYLCTLCGVRLTPDETIQHYDHIYGDLYVSCPYCRSECRPDYEDDRQDDAFENEYSQISL